MVSATSSWTPDVPIVWIYVVVGVCAAVLFVLLVGCIVRCVRACRGRRSSRQMLLGRISVKSAVANYAQDASPL